MARPRSSRTRVQTYVIAILVVAVYVWSLEGTDTSPVKLARGIPFMVDFASRMYPPDFRNLPKFLLAALETIQIAVVGSAMGTLVAFPASFLAARNTVPSRVVYQVTRFVLDVCRGVSEMIWALLFVAMVGLGPFPGVLAVTIHNLGSLGKYFSEAIENIDPRVVEAARATGANSIQVIFRAMVPELKPFFLNYIFYYFDSSVRSATALGVIGAGGLGLHLTTRIRLFFYHETLAILIIIILMVTAIDRLSAYVRKKIVGELENVA
jgi:phosphonate transport system permease protein